MKIKASIGVVPRLNLRRDYVSGVGLGKRKPKRQLTSGNKSNNAMPTLTIRHPYYPMVGVDTVRHWYKCMAKCLSIVDADDHPLENNLLMAGITHKWSNNVMRKATCGNLLGVDIRVIYGDETTLAQTGTRPIYVERTNLTSRLMNGRLVRKTLGFSKALTMLEASCVWEDVVYNLTRSVKTLRVEVIPQMKRRWIHRSPAMAAGITDHIWSIRQVLMAVPVPTNSI